MTALQKPTAFAKNCAAIRRSHPLRPLSLMALALLLVGLAIWSAATRDENADGAPGITASIDASSTEPARERAPLPQAPVDDLWGFPL